MATAGAARTRAVTLGSAVLVLALAAGCSSSTSTKSAGGDTAKDGKVTLNVDLFGTFGFKEAGLYAEYQKLHPNIEIKQTDTQDEAQYWQALQTKLAGGGGLADVQGIEVGRIASVVQKQADKFTDLKSLGLGPASDELVPWKGSAATTPDGKLLGLGTDIGPEAMCFRADLFKQAGLPTDRDQLAQKWSTWDGYLALGKQYAAKAKAGNTWTDSAASVFAAEVGQQRVRYFDEQGKPVYETSPAVKAAWNTSVSLVKDGLSAELPEWTPEWNKAFSTGKFATLSCPAWMGGYIKGQAGDAGKGKWDVAPGPGKTGNWGGSYLAIPRTSKHAKEAADLIKWLTAEEQQVTLFKKLGSFPSNKAAQAAIKDVKDPYFSDAPIGQIFSEAAAAMPAQVLGADDQVVTKAFTDALGEVERTKTAPDAAWKHAMDNVRNATGG
ncbi:extracellular solute-binding protein [Streptacidiphilus sp. ASG 303]|uniref:ABC transporter substrate-binding protein n=1 Tax=Streptacidiphilus sp. ASG 303 TaxID=2896847 RepID=UPI001E37DC4B|nr:extracellular solute-binding protein [Streptacidiphilus sp. ASG 303]MCD0481021.1 extracellular solute-binding protein [Streptacidiphilus sp. ASG 303]